MYNSRITAIGTYVPKRKLTNDDFEKMVDTSSDWIIQRTGILERRIAEKDEFTSDLCVSAVKNLVDRYNKSVEDVDFIIICTTTPDFPFPSVSCLIQDRLNIRNAGAIDISAACAGFVYGLITAHSMIAAGLHQKILVVAAETLSKTTDYTDRTSCILFGDGAGAILVEKDEEVSSFISHHVGSDGKGGLHIYRTGLSSRLNDQALLDNRCIVQNGREVFRWVTRTIPDAIKQLIMKSGLTVEQIDWFIPHSANLRLIEPLCEKTGFPIDRTLYSLVMFGNTSAASIPLSLDLGIRNGNVRNGDHVLLYGFGAGLVHSGAIIKLSFDPEVNAPVPL